MSLTDTSLEDWKALFRKRAMRTRAEAAKAGGNAAQAAAVHFMGTFGPEKPTKVALYHPIGDELDTAPLAERLMHEGHSVLLPVVTSKDAKLSFRLFEIDKPLVRGAFGIMEPPEEAETLTPDLVVTPLLAVRADGARLGMGGGFYDRTLAALRAGGDVLAIGIGYAAQSMARFPVAPHDETLDGFASEAGAERFARRG